MFDLDALLDAALERRTSDPNTAVAKVRVGASEVSLRFSELDSRSWAGCTLAGIAREGVVIDAVFGFDVTAAAEKAAPLSGVQVDGETVTELSPAQWAKLFAVLDSEGRAAVSDAVLAVNEDAKLERMEAAKKALEGASKRKRPSRVSSESPTDA